MVLVLAFVAYIIVTACTAAMAGHFRFGFVSHNCVTHQRSDVLPPDSWTPGSLAFVAQAVRAADGVAYCILALTALLVVLVSLIRACFSAFASLMLVAHRASCDRTRRLASRDVRCSPSAVSTRRPTFSPLANAICPRTLKSAMRLAVV